MKKATLWMVLVGCVLAVIVPCGSARGAPVSQTFTLRPGWNAVFLEVEPPNPDPAVVFAGVVGLESVWAWNRQTSPAEYIQNPALPIEPSPYMLAYFHGNASITNLYAIRGETAYLVKIAAGAPVTQSWAVNDGEPMVPKIDWKPNSFNLVGFHLDGSFPVDSLPRYFDFFSGSPAHMLEQASPAPPAPEIYVLENGTGSWRRVVASDRMQPGEAFWVYCQGASTFNGPLSVQLEQGRGLDFGAALDQQVVIFRNEYTAERPASVRALSGEANIHYGNWVPDDLAFPDGGSWKHTWENLFPTGTTLNVPMGGQSRLRLGAVRAGLAAGGVFETNVEISDGLGMRILLPAKVEGVGTAGLWVGSVVVDKVTSKATQEGYPTLVGSPFLFRIIIHVSDDATPSVSLLREVVQLWKAGTWKTDPDNPNRRIVDEPGEFVLVAHPDYLQTDAYPALRGAALRDGQEVGRRISTAAFAFDTPLPSSGGSFGSGDTLQFEVTLAPNDPANPFLHVFHKEHGATDSYQIIRTLNLNFQLNDPAGGSLGTIPFLGWGSSEVGGIYSETIGLRRAGAISLPYPDGNPWGLDASYDVTVAGTFRLRRVSDVGQLWVP